MEHNEYHYRRYEQQNLGFMSGLESYSVQTIYVTTVSVLTMIGHLPACSSKQGLLFSYPQEFVFSGFLFSLVMLSFKE